MNNESILHGCLTRGEIKKEIFKRIVITFLNEELCCCGETELMSLINIIVPKERFFNMDGSELIIDILTNKIECIVRERISYC
ncbi:MAG: hypothetical protein ACI9LM_003326 [Alteromonadaceae bacterium]|jgi:hypothetical protein